MAWGSAPQNITTGTLTSGSITIAPVASGTTAAPTLLVLYLCNPGSGANTITETGQTWTLLADSTSSGSSRSAIYTRVCTTAATLSIAITMANGASTATVIYEEWTGSGSTLVQDGSGSFAYSNTSVSNTSSVTAGTLAITPTVTGDLLLSSCVTGTGTAQTYTATNLTKSASSVIGKGVSGYTVGPAASTVTPQWAFAATRPYAATVAVVKQTVISTSNTSSGFMVCI